VGGRGESALPLARAEPLLAARVLMRFDLRGRSHKNCLEHFSGGPRRHHGNTLPLLCFSPEAANKTALRGKTLGKNALFEATGRTGSTSMDARVLSLSLARDIESEGKRRGSGTLPLWGGRCSQPVKISLTTQKYLHSFG